MEMMELYGNDGILWNYMELYGNDGIIVVLLPLSSRLEIPA